MPRRMRVVLFFTILSFSSIVLGQGSSNVTLLAERNQYPSTGYSDGWGYTASDGREYALLGVKSGTSIIDITDTNNLREVAFISGNLSSWREIKTYQHYAYVVNENGGGMQIIDLSNLPNSASLAGTYTGFLTSHNIWIDSSAGILYAEGNSTQPVRVLSLSTPVSPVQIGFFGVECHDVYVQNNRAYVSEGNRGSVGIYDVTTPSSAVRLATVNLGASPGYAHNAWTTADANFLLSTEENTSKTVKMWNIADFNNVTFTDDYIGPELLAHNVYANGSLAYVAHYSDGLRIVNISDPNNIFEAGYYDTYPTPAGGQFVGAWGAYPFFASGKILIFDMQTGLYVVRFDTGGPNSPNNLNATAVSSSQIDLTWQDNSINETGFKIERKTGSSGTYAEIASVAANVVSYPDTGRAAGTTYFYRVRAFNGSGNSGYSNEASATTPGGSVNLALNKPASASSTYGTSTPARAVDGSTGTFWRSGTLSSNTIVWLRVDLLSAQTISRVVIKWRGNYYAKQYLVQISNDNVNWTTVHNENSGNGGTDSIVFGSTSARYVRVYMTLNNKASERINEFGVY